MILTDFNLTDKQRDLVSAFREYGERTFTREAVRQWRDDQGLPDDVVQEFVSLYFSLTGEESSGSIPDSLFSQALILEELSRCAGATLPFQNDLFGLHIMAGFASDNDFSTVIDEYKASGRVIFALAVSEPQAGSDSMNMKTCVQHKNGKLVLNGVKTFVNNGEYAPNILVAAIDKEDKREQRHPALSFWFLPRNLEGVSVYPINKIGQPMLPFASVKFDNVELKSGYRLSGSTTGAATGFPHLFALLEAGRVFTSATCLGMAQAAMEDAVAYADQRRAFSTRIADFQQIEQMLTDMELRLTNMRNIVYSAALKVDEDATDKRLAVTLMKRYVPAAATQVASDAMQILGGMGYTEGERVSHIWQDCRGNQLAEGTDQIMVYIAAPLIMKKYLGDK